MTRLESKEMVTRMSTTYYNYNKYMFAEFYNEIIENNCL